MCNQSTMIMTANSLEVAVLCCRGQESLDGLHYCHTFVNYSQARTLYSAVEGHDFITFCSWR